MRLFYRGDLDGFFGLAIDNLVQLLLIEELCKQVLGFPDELLYGRVLPGAAVSLLVGNLFYAWQAHRLAARTGREDVCALPYGINTPSVLAYVFLVMLPVKLDALRAGADPVQAAYAAWRMGLVACVGSGLIEFLGAFVAEPIRRMTPRAALLSTLAGIALGFISGVFLFRTFANPIVGLTTFAIVLLVYFGRVRFKGGLPGGFVAVAVGTALAWASGLAQGSWPSGPPHFWPPTLSIADIVEPLRGREWLRFLTVIIPMGLFNLIGSLQNIESAEAAGDAYPTTPSLAMNGVSTLAAAAFGSCFPTTIYIGHPGWKALGARAGYSTLNGVFFTVVCLFGLLGYIAHAIPIDAGMAIVLWIGIVITAQAFQATPREHAPAVVIGLLPGIAAWASILMQSALRAGHKTLKLPDSICFPLNTLSVELKHDTGTWFTGVLALEQGFIFTASILAAATVAVIERRFWQAGLWCLVGAALSATGLMHNFEWQGFLAANVLRFEWTSWATGYAAMATCFFLAPLLTELGDGH